MLSLDTQGLYFPLTYKIGQKTCFSVNGSVINETETEIEWNIEQISNFGDETIVHIKTGSHNVIKYNQQYRQLIEFMCMFNIPISDLVLVLDRTGTPVKVKNQEDIYERWKALRLGSFSHLENDETVRPILAAADNDFKNTITLIKKTPLYVLFLQDVYGQEIISNSSLFILPSQIFTGKDVVFKSSREIQSNGDGYLKISVDAGGVPKGDFRKLYNDKFKQLFQDTSYKYENNLKASYSYDSKQGIMDSCQAELVEKLAKDKMCSKQEFEFKFIKEEIKVWRNY
ncbi:hypothetical protein CTM62_11045 [Prevotella intermedia]|uniref:Uncharacterized protein n=1 Tax=Prevotella intermedia TaxID=28131 RepID=A0A2D3L9V4_PREIN|nr:hypothetical protein CTM62_11045 [Prevotella intermedia]